MLLDSHEDAYFEAGDTVKVGPSFSVHRGEIEGIFRVKDGLEYRITWSRGNTTTNDVERIDAKARNRSSRTHG